MDQKTKTYLLIAIVVVAVIAAGYSAFRTVSGPKEEVVGTLPMPEGGGRDAEKGAGQSKGEDPSGMPAGMANPK